MANKFHTVLRATGIEKMWNGESFDSLIPSVEKEYQQYSSEYDPVGIYGWRDKNWGCDGRIFHSEVTENKIQFLTAWKSPLKIAQKISEMIGNKKLEHIFYDQDNYGSDVIKYIWENGYIVEAYKSSYNWDKDEYDDFLVSINREQMTELAAVLSDKFK